MQLQRESGNKPGGMNKSESAWRIAGIHSAIALLILLTTNCAFSVVIELILDETQHQSTEAEE